MKTAKTRLAISQPISTWTQGPEGIHAHTYTLTLYLKGDPDPKSGWIFPHPQLQELLKNKTNQYQGYSRENSPYALLESICNCLRNSLKNSTTNPTLEGLSLSWERGQYIYRLIE